MDWKLLIGSKFLLLILLSPNVLSDADEKRVVCYYTNWSVYRPGTAKFTPQNINPYLCTHLIYAFGGFTKDNTLKPFDKYQDVDKGGYAKFTGLKSFNKNLKVLLAIGGWNEGSSRFSPMVADPERRKKFVKNAVKFLRQNHFDGLDLDWEYPAFRDGGKPRDRDNYANLVQELREEFEKESSKTGKPRLLLTMAVPAGIEYIEKGYDIPKLNEYLDFINLLSYDYHSAYEPAVNHHSPLYPLEEDNEYNYDNELTIDYTIKHLTKAGASSDKIVIGIPTYGRSYTLFNEDATALGSPADGPGDEGDATREKGYLAYYEICESIAKDGWTVEKPNPKAMGPFAYKGNQWVGYDDEDIVRAKAKYVNENNLGGIMFWSIDNDDFRGKCHGRPYPLIEAAKEALFEENEKDKVDERPNSISTKKRNRVSENPKSNSLTTQRKSNTNRRNTTSRSTSEKRASTLKSRGRATSKVRNEQKSDEADDGDAEHSEKVETKSPNKSTRTQTITNQNRFRTRLNNNDRNNRKKQTSEPNTTPKTSNKKLSTPEIPKTSNKKTTTPEPPTTPDPGSDFKCEDEGFFPHPRDCKKYFWCLDSGPSGLGIVANQFTCPSGLVFNKLADSCDYPRNVVCPKIKNKSTTTTTSTTTKRTTTEKEIEEEDDEENVEYEEEEEEEEDVKADDEKVEDEKLKKVSTTAKPLLYKTINRSRPTSAATTTTTTEIPPTTGSARSVDDASEEEQDPRVIKELIDLIKKAGGIEHLEKQLALQEKNAGTGSDDVTPATISKSLYERVLNRQNGKNNLFGIQNSRLSSSRRTEEKENEDEEKSVQTKSSSKTRFLNGPGRSQFEGLDEVPEVKSLRRSSRPKYVTIERHSSSTTSSRIDDEEVEEDDEEEENDSEDVASSEEKLISNVPEEKQSSTPKSTPGYVNIRRTRPPTTTTESLKDDDNNKKELISKEEPTFVYSSSIRPTEATHQEVTELFSTTKSKYISANRFRSTTIVPQKESEPMITETLLTQPVSTTPEYIENPVTEGKTITVAGESGRISITPFTSPIDTPSTARIFTETLPSTVKSTIANEEKSSSTPFTTKTVFETTIALNPNIIDDAVTESIATIAPTESSTRETIAAVSQPRPFGFPRRTRPTIAATIVTDTTRRSLSGVESTVKPKVFDELILDPPISKEVTVIRATNDYMTENPKKTSTLNDSFSSKPEFLEGTLLNSSKQNHSQKIVKVPVRFVDGPDNELFLIEIPENKLNSSKFGSYIQLQILNSNDYSKNNENIVESENTTNTAHIDLNSSVTKLDTIKKIHKLNTEFENNNNTSLPKQSKTVTDSQSSKIVQSFGRNEKDVLYLNSNRSTSIFGELDTPGNVDMKLMKSAILNSQRSLIQEKKPFINNQLLQNKDSNNKKKVHRQRVLIYRGSAKHNQPTNSSSESKWIVKKIVRKRIRRIGTKPEEDSRPVTTPSVAEMV